MTPSLLRKNASRRQRGTIVIEFALAFTIIWAVFWSLACYVAPLIVLQTMHRASAEGARVGAMVANPALRRQQAELAAQQEMNRLPASWRQGVSTTATVCGASNPDGSCLLTVTITQPYATNAPLRPIISWPGVGTIPSLPATLRSQVTLLLN